MNEHFKDYLMEVIGAFFLVFAIGMSVLEPSAGSLTPLAVGATLLVMIFIGGHISGGHYNPAVTLAVFMQKGINIYQFWGYIISQVIGACLAAALVVYLKDGVASNMLLNYNKAFVAELFYTFLLVFAVLSTSLLPRFFNSLWTGIAVGLVVATGIITVGSISGASFNPAVVIGSVFLGIYSWEGIWIILLANFLASFCAGMLFIRIKDLIPIIRISGSLYDRDVTQERGGQTAQSAENNEAANPAEPERKTPGVIRLAKHGIVRDNSQ